MRSAGTRLDAGERRVKPQPIWHGPRTPVPRSLARYGRNQSGCAPCGRGVIRRGAVDGLSGIGRLGGSVREMAVNLALSTSVGRLSDSGNRLARDVPEYDRREHRRAPDARTDGQGEHHAPSAACDVSCDLLRRTANDPWGSRRPWSRGQLRWLAGPSRGWVGLSGPGSHPRPVEAGVSPCGGKVGRRRHVRIVPSRCRHVQRVR
jgi:hypothetical protein